MQRSQARPLVLHRFLLSGHCHRVELFLSLLGLEAQLVDVNLVVGDQRRPEFLAKNAFGQVPVLEDGDVVLSDSNAILVYLANRYDREGVWLPRDPVLAARTQRWLSVAAGPLASGPAAARVARLFGRPDDVRAQEQGRKLFDVMNAELETSQFFGGERPTIADLALYTYTAHAPEGGISLEPWPRLRAWLGRIEALDRFVPMQAMVS